MKIGIIGAGISGLTAGRELAMAGHEVIVFEKNKAIGGRLSTFRKNGDSFFPVDYGTPYITGSSDEFREFVQELEEKKIIRLWTDTYSGYSEGTLLSPTHEKDVQPYYCAPEGMESIAGYLSRFLDIYTGEKIGNLTHIGSFRNKKSPWMLSSSAINVFEADAVVIATPAIQAYGLVSTAQDELELRKMITVLDEISYTSTITFMAGYGERPIPEWQAISCKHPVISHIYNESGKRNRSDSLNIVVHTTDAFTRKVRDEVDVEETEEMVFQSLGDIIGPWAGRPEWHQSHLWKYHLPKNNLDMPFLESEDEYAPLAVTGDYFQGKSVEVAYLSGLRLGRHWVEKFS